MAVMDEKTWELVAERLRDTNYWHLATINEDGSPTVSPVWVDLRNDRIVVNTATRHKKYKNMVRNTAVALSNMDKANPFDHVQIHGEVVQIIVGAEAERDCDAMAVKYTGGEYKFRSPGEARATIVIAVSSARHFAP